MDILVHEVSEHRRAPSARRAVASRRILSGVADRLALIRKPRLQLFQFEIIDRDDFHDALTDLQQHVGFLVAEHAGLEGLVDLLAIGQTLDPAGLECFDQLALNRLGGDHVG